MLGDDTNLFYSQKHISALFQRVNNQLYKVNQRLISNKLSLNIKKTIYWFLHNLRKKDGIPLLLLQVKTNNYEIKRAKSPKFYGVLLDENLNRKSNIKYIENKIVKIISLLFKAKQFLIKQLLLSLYYSYTHSYINYANVAWESTYMTKSKKSSSQEKLAMRIICNNFYPSTLE